MVSETLVRRWEAAYRAYGLASETVSSSVPGDGAVARDMARASRDVATVWREMAAEPDIPWWSIAALSAAAQAFEHQARDWTARAKYDPPAQGGKHAMYPVAGRREQHDQYVGGEADAG
jgi:hypothetical protein